MNRTTAHPVSDLISTKIASPCMFRVELALQSSLWPLTTALTRKLRQISNCISYHCSAALRKFDFSANPLQSFLTLRLKLCHLAWIHSTEFWEISSQHAQLIFNVNSSQALFIQLLAGMLHLQVLVHLRQSRNVTCDMHEKANSKHGLVASSGFFSAEKENRFKCQHRSMFYHASDSQPAVPIYTIYNSSGFWKEI